MPGRSAVVAAVDLGASSGRVLRARVSADELTVDEVHRFAGGPVRVLDTLHVDVVGIHREVLAGLRAAGPVDAVAVDSWGIDHGLLDAAGALVGVPVHHRDARTDGVAARVHESVPPPELYAATGTQEQAFTTIYQLVAAARTPVFAAAHQILMIPDLLSYWLTGERGAEITNASTTGLLDPVARRWHTSLAVRVGLDPGLLPPLREPGTTIGTLLPAVAEETGLDPATPVLAVGSHDTASAVVGTPAAGERFAFVSCGTWSLVGTELAAPVLTEDSRAANFASELGVDGTVRHLRNLTGLWLLQECLRSWGSPPLEPLLESAAAEPALAAVIDVEDPDLVAPGDMPERIAAACRATGQEPPATRAGIVRCVVDSLALAHRRTVRRAAALSGREVDVVHVVGGGARNVLLCRLTADACGLPVVAGPVEATALGNVLVQARALGVLTGGLGDLRAFLARHVATVRHEPDPGAAVAWDRAEDRLAAGR